MAAAVFIPPSPHDSFANMATSTRRQPLMSIPNATNSPHRNLNNSSSKRSRAVANVAQLENEPPSKRQAVEKSNHQAGPITPRYHRQTESAEGRVFERGQGDNTNAFQRRLVAARDNNNNVQKRTTRSNNTTGTTKDAEQVRQWQKHYRRLFPTFSFYFDSVPEDVKTRFSKQIQQLGAREEKFFSKHVTHIVTTRSIPQATSSSKGSVQDVAQGTINPSLLDFKAGRSNTSRREVISNNDILIRGLEMDMKIWATEKLQRMLTTLLNDGQGQDSTTRGQHGASRAPNDLAQVLKNDKMTAAAEKEHVGMPRELIPFRGPFIYVHDMDEKVKPIMVREYAKVARRTDGEWPQFRSASVGKCPFVEDPQMKKEIEQERARQKAAQLQQQKEASEAMQRHPVLTTESAKMEPPRRTSPRKILRERPNPNTTAAQQMNVQAPPPPSHERQSSFPPMPEHPPVEFIKPSQMQLVREPSASGINKSVMTSAIQSQMISSAAATGMKAGTSKEVNELKRKVLERTHTGSLSIGSISSSHQINSITGALKNVRAPAPQRAAKSRAQEKLGGIQEEVDPYADDQAAERAACAVVKKRKPTKREPKPGYCENCHDKYDDFEEHIVSRKHRKFAITDSNWGELDALLAKLQEP